MCLTERRDEEKFPEAETVRQARRAGQQPSRSSLPSNKRDKRRLDPQCHRRRGSKTQQTPVLAEPLREPDPSLVQAQPEDSSISKGGEAFLGVPTLSRQKSRSIFSSINPASVASGGGPASGDERDAVTTRTQLSTLDPADLSKRSVELDGSDT